MRETRNLLIAVARRSNSRHSRFFVNWSLLSVFLIQLSRAAFCRVLASACEVKHRFCVKFRMPI